MEKDNELQDESGAFEEAIKREGGTGFYDLKLFITGMTSNSMRAVTNIKRICNHYLKNNHTLEIVDVYQNAELAKGENIIVTPTLIRKFPGPVRRLVGDLSNTNKVLSILEINGNEQRNGHA